MTKRPLLDQASLKWVRDLVGFLTLLTFLDLLNDLMGRTVIPNFYFASSFLTLYIGYVGLTRPEVFSLGRARTAKEPPAESGKKIEKLKLAMVSERPYLDSNLTLSRLARLLQIPAPELSILINHGIAKSFSDFVNDYRIEEAKRQLVEGGDKVDNIGFACGFNSKSTFYAAFRRMESCTPNQHRRMQSGSIDTSSN